MLIPKIFCFGNTRVTRSKASIIVPPKNPVPNPKPELKVRSSELQSFIIELYKLLEAS